MLYYIFQTSADQILFVAACLAIWWWFDRKFVRHFAKEFRLKLGLAVGSLAIASIAISLTVGNLQKEQLRNSISGFAPTYATELQSLGHASIRDASQSESPEYHLLIERLKNWLKLNPTAHDIYTMRRVEDGIARLIVDAETDYDRNGVFEGDREQRTAIGEVFPKPTMEMEMGFRGIPWFHAVPYQDRWGLWVSACAPIFDENGKVDGIVGVDFAAMDWIKSILFVRGTVLLIALAVITGFVGCVSFISMIRHQLFQKQQFSEQLEQQALTLQEANQALSQARDAAQQASRAKSDFLANMSHEIRTPMNGIMGLTELLLNSRMEAEQRRHLELIQSSADALMTVLNDILDFSKIEANKMAFDPQPFDLRDMLGDSLKLFGLRAHHKQIELALSVPTSVPNYVVGDAGRIRQILVNMVGNAIKFTHSGEVVVSVDCVPLNEKTSRLKFQVRDTGIGIEQSKVEKIFEPFSQADNSTTRKYGGTGLGLTICKRLIELMGGNLAIESTVNVGTVISFELDLDRPEEQVELMFSEEQITLEKMRVLVVDDNDTNRLILREMLASWQIEASILDSGIEVVRTLEQAIEDQNPFDLVLMDVQMPEIDGFDTTRQIRNSKTAADTRVIMLSSCDASVYTEQVCNLGLAAYLTKPIKQSELLESILSSLKRPSSTLQQRLNSRISRKQSLESTMSSIRPLKILVAEDNFVNQQLMLRVLSKAGHEIQLANHGREAVEMTEKTQFDIVLMDVQMPHLDGYEATQVIRNAGRLSRSGNPIPIVALTANAMKGDREKCLASGMDDYASKPIQFAKLFEVIAGLLPEHLLNRSTNESTEAIESDSSAPTTSHEPMEDLQSIPVLNRDELRDRIDGDLDLLEILFSAFDSDIDGHLSRLEQCIASGDDETARKLVHTIKGTSANLGGTRVSAMAKAMEHQLTNQRDRSGLSVECLKQTTSELRTELKQAVANRVL